MRYFNFAILFLCLSFFSCGNPKGSLLTKWVTYSLPSEPVDVIIPSTEKDLDTLELCIEGIKKNGKNIRRVIVVSSKKLTDSAEWFDEKLYPFSKKDIIREIFKDEARAEEYLQIKGNRAGWVLQQLLKLYAFKVIPGLSSNILILDSDSVFLHSVEFVNSKGEGLYNPGSEHHLPYFGHMKRFLPGLQRVYPKYSGISHHMLFQRPVLEDLFWVVESHHKEEFWKAFCHAVRERHLKASCASEYEIYFNFIFSRTKQMHIRKLTWKNSSSIGDLPEDKSQGFDYVSLHSYMR